MPTKREILQRIYNAYRAAHSGPVPGPQSGGVASGGAGTIYGPAGTRIPVGTQLVDDATGSVIIELAAEVTIAANQTVSGTFRAVRQGAAGNLVIGAKLRWLTPPPGVAATVTLGTALTSGFDLPGGAEAAAWWAAATEVEAILAEEA